MDQSTHDIRRANWLNIVSQCQVKPDKISVKQWLADNGIKEKAYYYWLRKFRIETYTQMQVPATLQTTEVSFAEIPVPVVAKPSSAVKKPRKPKKKGQREEDLKDFPQEEIPHDVAEEKLVDTFGEGNYKSMPDEICWQLRFEPKWIAEKHIIKVYVGTDGLHQDEFLRGDYPNTLFRGSIATPSLEAIIPRPCAGLTRFNQQS